MLQKSITQKLLKNAFILSPIIGILVIIPPFFRFQMTASQFVIMASVMISFIFFIWVENIFTIYLFEKLSQKKYKNFHRYLLSFILTIIISIVYKYFMPDIMVQPPHTANPQNNLIGPPIIFGIFLNTIILVVQELALLKDKKSKVELENAQLKIKNSEALYQQLKQQIHPHFLFNSLNVLKTLIRKNPDLAEDYLVKLSDFLRISIQSKDLNVVKMQDEISLCVDYLEMQKVRFGNALQYEINVSQESINSKYLPVFALQTLVENAIKHNSLTEDAPLLIKIFEEENLLVVTNNIQPKISNEVSTGMGLANLGERYRILSGDELTIRINKENFTVKIKLIT